MRKVKVVRRNSTRKLMRIYLISLIGILLLSSVSLAVNNVNNSTISSDNTTNSSTSSLDKNIPITGNTDTEPSAPSTYEQMQKMKSDNIKKIIERKKLSKEKIQQLYNQGYGVEDISNAEKLSFVCGSTAEEILEIKGKPSYTNDGKSTSKTWSEVKKALGLDLKSQLKKLKIPTTEYENMKKKGLTNAQIVQIGVLVKNYDKNYEDVSKEVKNGKKIKDLEKTYWQDKEMKEQQLLANKTDKEKKDEYDREVKERFNITDDDIVKCKSMGITEMSEIGFAKSIAQKNGIALEKVLELKKSKKTWVQISEQLSGGKK